MLKFNTKVGDKFNHLTIKEFTRTKYVGKNKNVLIRYCLAECDCGNIKEYALNNIKSGMSSSCGCKPIIGCRGNISNHPLYKTYAGIITRCYNKKEPSYKNYGGRGITVCKKWLNSFESFVQDMGERPSKKHSIDRIDVNGDYEPDNCRWATRKQQMNNIRKSYLLTISNLARITGYSVERIRQLSGICKGEEENKELVRYIKSIDKQDGGNYTIIYNNDAIQFLLQRKSANLTNQYSL